MVTEDTLLNEVQAYLQQHHSFKLDLPDFSASIDAKITLKQIVASIKKYNGQTYNPESRYMALIDKAQQLLKKNTINSPNVNEFGQEFFTILQQDISILMNNEQLRGQATHVRDRIIFKGQQIQAIQVKIKEECLQINDKKEVLSFLESSLKQYFSKIEHLREHYNGVSRIEVATSINIDSLYREQLAHQQNYMQHYQPLVQVMQRLKSNMMKLHQETKKCETYQVPLKSVNFLANCRNLLTELKPFLVDQACTFNRLIFHVVEVQRKNLLLITQIYQTNLLFAKQVLTDSFKCFFFGFIFKDYYRSISSQLKLCKAAIIKIFQQNQNVNIENVGRNAGKSNRKDEIVKKETAHLSQIQANLRKANRILGSGKDSIMHQYIKRKICKKMAMIVELKLQRSQIQKLLTNVNKYAETNYKIQEFLFKLDKVQQKILTDVKQLDKRVDIRTYLDSRETGLTIQQRKRNVFKENFIAIQQNTLEVSIFEQILEEYRATEGQEYFRQKFFPKKLQQISKISILYLDMQTRLLNSFQNMRKEKSLKQFQATNIRAETIKDVQWFINQRVPDSIGYDILNEDELSEDVKLYLDKVDRAQYMVETHLDRQEFLQLQKLKFNLEWLLVLFQGSMDDKILESMIDKLDFDRQDWKQHCTKVQLFLKDVSIYVKDLKKLQTTNDISKLDPKVLKIIKERTQLYELVEDIFSESILVFKECKRTENQNIQTQGARLFDQKSYKYVLMMYQFKNKLRTENMQLQQLLIPQKTKNYLTDQIYQPFIQRFYSHISYSEEQLLNFTLRFEHTLTLDKNLSVLQRALINQIYKPYHQQYFSDIQQVSTDLVHVGEENQLVKDLVHERLVIHNMVQFNDKAQRLNPYVKLAKKIVQEMFMQQLRLKIETKNETVQKARDHLINVWNEKHRIVEKRSQHSQMGILKQRQIELSRDIQRGKENSFDESSRGSKKNNLGNKILSIEGEGEIGIVNNQLEKKYWRSQY